MAEKKVDVSIIIPAKNEERTIQKCLEAVFRQKTAHAYEIILIDSGSTDGTIGAAGEFPGVTTIRIKSEEFGHGRTRNLGAGKAKGELLIFLNADAWPADEHWLDSLISGFETDEAVAGVYSRHFPKEGAPLYMVRDLEKSMPRSRMVRERAGKLDFALFSTVSGAMRKSVWRKFPFDEKVPIAEDQEWGERVLREGYRIVYEPSSAVFHSHRYSPRQMFRVKYQVGKAGRAMGRRFHGPFSGLAAMAGGIIFKISGDVPFIMSSGLPFRQKMRELGESMAARAASFAGRYIGSLSK